jgi:predicted ArsR family transcriptional regulator
MSRLLDPENFVAEKLAWHQRIASDPTVSLSAKAVAGFILHDLNASEGGAWRGQESMAAGLGVSERQLRRLLEELEAASYLQGEVRRGRGRTNICRATLPDERAVASEKRTSTAAQTVEKRTSTTVQTPKYRTLASRKPDRNIDRPTIVVDAAKLVAELRRSNHLPPTWLLDFADGLKLLNGVAKNDGGARRSDAWRFIVAHARARNPPAVAPEVQALFEASVDWPDAPEGPVTQLTQFADEVASAWSAVCDALEARGEAERFERVEAPSSQVFYERQAAGIEIDQGRLKDLLEVAEREKYVAYNDLAEAINVSPSGLTTRTVGAVLPRTDAAHLAAFADAPMCLAKDLGLARVFD